MPVFRYKAVSPQGVMREGNETASSQGEMLARLRARELHPVSIQEVVEKKDIKDLSQFSKVKIKQIAVFNRQFATMLASGVSIVNCLDILRQQTQHKRFKDVITEIYEDVQKGNLYSEALKKHKDVFPPLMINMVAAGEVSGSLDVVMSRIAVHFEKEAKINNRIKSAMGYPLVLSVVAVLVVIFLLTFVMPTFLGLFEGSGVALPGPTVALLAISGALRNYWYIFLIVIAAVVYIIRRYIGTEKGRLAVDRLKLRLPIFRGLTQKVASARFTRTLSTLLASGIPLLQALENVAGAVGNQVISNSILSAREDIRKGAALSVPIRKAGLFPPMVPSMIEIGEEAGTLDDILEKTANIYDEEVDLEVQRLLSLLEPMLIVVMAVVIGFIVIAMLLPMFDMLQTVQ